MKPKYEFYEELIAIGGGINAYNKIRHQFIISFEAFQASVKKIAMKSLLRKMLSISSYRLAYAMQLF